MSMSAILNLQDCPTTDTCARLSVVVLVSSLTMPRWMHRMLITVSESDCACLAAIVCVGEIPSRSAGHSANPFLLRSWQQLDRALFRLRSPQPAAFDLVTFDPTPGTEVLAAGAQNSVDPSVDSSSLSTVIEKTDPDVILNLAGSKGQLRRPSQYKGWIFDYEPEDAELLHSLYNGAPALADAVVVSGPRGSGRWTCSHVPADQLSFFRTHATLCWRRTESLLRCLSVIREGGDHLQLDREDIEPPTDRSGRFTALSLCSRLAGRALREALTKATLREEWFIAYRETTFPVLADRDRDIFTVVRPPRGRFYADPFITERGDCSFIFFEDYSYREHRAVISFVQIDRNGNCSQPDLALEEDYHVAFPSLFEWQGQLYLLPETKNHRTVQLYRSVVFPNKWELAYVLLDGVASADSTLLNYGGKLWLFTSGLGTEDPWFDGCSELSLLYADQLPGPWAFHAKSPVVRDIRCARSAGQLFWDGPRLIRPAQDSAGRPGRAVCFQWVHHLSEKDYRESPVARIDPDWMPGNRGTHTFNRSSRYEVLDGRTLISRFSSGRTHPGLEIFRTREKVLRSL